MLLIELTENVVNRRSNMLSVLKDTLICYSTNSYKFELSRIYRLVF